MPARPRIPRSRRLPVLPRGPELYSGPGLRVVGPGNPPNGFVGGQNSATEWTVFWGLWKVFREPGDPRRGPWFGSPTGKWTYQSHLLGGRHVRGGVVVDFVVYGGGAEEIGIRVQTERFHLFVDSRIQAYDRLQNKGLGSRLRLVDIYEQDFVADESGEAVIVTLKNVISGVYESDPLLTGRARRERRD